MSLNGNSLYYLLVILKVLGDFAFLIIGIFITTSKIKQTRILGIGYIIDAILGFISNVITMIRLRGYTSALIVALGRVNSVVSVAATLAGILFICLYVHKNYKCKWIYFPLFAQPVVNTISSIAFRAVLSRIGDTAQYIVSQGLATNLTSLVTGSVGAIILILVFYKNRNIEKIIPHTWAIKLAAYCVSLVTPIVSIIFYVVSLSAELRGAGTYFYTSYKLTVFQNVFLFIYSLVCLILPIYILVMVKRAEKKLEETSPYIED